MGHAPPGRFSLQDYKGEPPKATDLLHIIALQQDEIAELSAQAALGDKRIAVLKTALQVVERGGEVKHDDDAVTERGRLGTNALERRWGQTSGERPFAKNLQNICKKKAKKSQKS